MLLRLPIIFAAAAAEAVQSTSHHSLLAEAFRRAELLASHRRAHTCHTLLSDFLSPPNICYVRAQEAASKKAFTVGKSNVNLPNDVYAVTSTQHLALILLQACRGHSRLPDWAAKRKLALLSRATNILEFLAEENADRRRWTQRLARFLWFNYEQRAFPAPEMDPRTGQVSRGEWTTEPMFVLDNLDALHMFQLDQSLDRMIRWIELSTIIVESISGSDRYVKFAEAFPSSSTEKSPLCTMQNLYTLASSWIAAATLEDASHLTSTLAQWLDLCFAYTGQRDVSTRDLLHVIRANPQFMPIFHEDNEVSFFEFTIRGVGGLLSAYQLRGHPVLLYKAWDAGFRMSYALFSCYAGPPRELARLRRLASPMLDYPPCVPERHVSWRAWSDLEGDNKKIHQISTPAVAGSHQLEFAVLSDLTGICLFTDQSQRIMRWLLSESQMPLTGFFPKSFYARREKSKQEYQGGSLFSVGAEADSMFEYLLKSVYHSKASPNSILASSTRKFSQVFPTYLDSIVNSTEEDVAPGFSDQLMQPQKQHHGSAAGTLRLGTTRSPLKYQNTLNIKGVPGHTSLQMTPEHTHLGCFSAGMLSLMSDLPSLGKTTSGRLRTYGEQVAEGCAAMYLGTATGIGGEETQVHAESRIPAQREKMGKIRPEVLEGLAYQYHATGKEKYRNLAWKLLDATMANARVQMGLCSIDDTTQFPAQYRECRQDTWILAETLKYYLLIFSSPEKIKNQLIRPSINLTAAQENGRQAVWSLMNQSRPATAEGTALAKIREALYGPNFVDLRMPQFTLSPDKIPEYIGPDVWVPRSEPCDDFGDIGEIKTSLNETLHPFVNGKILNTEAHPFLQLAEHPCAATDEVNSGRGRLLLSRD